MKAVIFNEYGPDVISLTNTLEIPTREMDHVLVNVKAVSFNRMDSMLIAGHLREYFPVNLPAVIAGDFAGIVVAVGSGVKHLIAGDEVYGQSSQALGGSGALAEYTLVQGDKVAKRPKNITMNECASLPMAGISALQAIESHLKLSHGQKILIHGGTGGIGSLAIQLAKIHGAYVATTIDGRYAQLVEGLGADLVIDYKTQNFAEVISDFDAVVVTNEIVLKNSYLILKENGVLISLVGDGDEVLTESYGITTISQMTDVNLDHLSRLTLLIDQGILKPVIDKVFSYEEAVGAFNYFEKANPKGKVIITI
jgi:NADPH:quinone reductase-like Zn-dependent oxidoreductase